MRKIEVKGKTAQMQISFGVIFSIILIVIFLAFAVYAITKFMEMKTIAQIEKFKSDLQSDIDKMWKSTGGSQEVQYLLPNKVKQVCFVDDENQNIYFIPDGFNGGLLKNINFAKTLSGKKTLCISTANGKVLMTLKKSFNEAQVTIIK